MALHIFSTIVSNVIPSSYYFPGIVVILLLATIRAISQGRRTNRDRDLHARTVILTGAFTPLGLTALEFLAKRGAHIIVLVPTPSITTHQEEILSLLRSTSSNEAIYAEPCPLDSPSEIKKFCARFVNAENEKDRRVDAIILAHEYNHIGAWATGFRDIDTLRLEESLQRDEGAMATFLLITLLLPALLVAPSDRDIRIINFVNPFYAASAPAFYPRLSSKIYNPTFSQQPRLKGPQQTTAVMHSMLWALEGQRALRTAVFTRHLQRILDALPEPGSAATSSSAQAGGAKNEIKTQKSNIMAVTVSPGISRTDTVAPYILPPPSSLGISSTRHWLGALLYILLLPLLYLFTKTPASAFHSVQHVLCVPKPLTRRRVPIGDDVAQTPSQTQSPPTQRGPISSEEVLVPGALYADCSIVSLDLRVAEPIAEDEDEILKDDNIQFDLRLGNEPLGRSVWEALEEGVKIWEEREKEKAARIKTKTQ